MRILAVSLALATAATLVLPLRPTSASPAEGVAFDFPPAGMETRGGGPRLAEFLGPALSLTPDYFLGLHALAQVTVTEVDEKTISIRMRNLTAQTGEAEPWVLTQQISERTEAGYRIEPSQLPLGLEIFYADVLSSSEDTPLVRVRAFGPPGAWMKAEDEADASEALAARLGLPSAGASSWNLTALANYRLPVYDLEPPDWNPHVYLECLCSVWTRHDARLGGLNSISTVFTGGHDLVAVDVQTWVNLSASRVLPENRAVELAKASLKERGYDVESLQLRTVSVSYSNLHLVYLLSASTSTHELSMVQNAHTGELESVNAKIGDALPRQPRFLPDVGSSTILAILAAGGLYRVGKFRRS